VLTDKSNVFVTGATGLIGGEFVRTLISQPIGQVWALIRVARDGSPATRLRNRLRRSVGSLSSEATAPVHAMGGDVSAPRFGLSDVDYEEVQRDVDIIIHSAAETSFIRTEDCRRTNIAGAENLVQFTRSCRRHPLLVCLSTAYVSGVVANTCVSEEDSCSPGNEHHNEYTRSKAVAEELVRFSGLPVLVVRPSIVLSAGVPDAAFARAILGFAPLLRELDAIPVNPEARADVVPVQFVVDSIVRLLQLPARQHECYHISGGEVAVNHAHLARVFDGFYQRQVPLRLIPPAQWTRELHRRYVSTPSQRKAFAALRNYLPFLNMNVLFDNSRLRQELGDHFPPLPHFADYFEELLALAAHTRPGAQRVRSGAVAQI